MMSSKLQTNLQPLQIHNHLEKNPRSTETMPPLPQKSYVSKETLQKPKVSSTGVNPIRKSSEIDKMNVMLVGNSIAEESDEIKSKIRIPQHGSDEKSLQAQIESISAPMLNQKAKMPAILSSVGTAAKPGYSIRAKPPAMPRSRLKPRKKTNLQPLQPSQVPLTRHTLTPVMDKNKGPESDPTFSEALYESNEQTEATKSVVSVHVTDTSLPSPSPVRSVDDMIQALRSSRQTSASHKSASDKKIDDIMKQVMLHAEEWMGQEITTSYRDEEREEPSILLKSDRSEDESDVTGEQVEEPEPTSQDRINENEVDISDTVSTLASQISAPAGIPDVSKILARKSSHAMYGQSVSETSSPAMMVVPDDEDSFDREQAEKDFNLSLDVRYDDILSVQGGNPPLVEKPAVIIPDSDVEERAKLSEDLPFSFNDGGRIHRLCLLPSINELNVTSEELALTKYFHAKSDVNLTADVARIKRELNENISTSNEREPNFKTTKADLTPGYLDSSKLDPSDIEGWRKIVEGAFETTEYSISGSGTDIRNVAAWRLLSTNVPPKMALTTAAVKALIFPNYDGSQIIEAVQEEKESWTEDGELSEIVIEDTDNREYNERSIYRRHNSVESLVFHTDPQSGVLRISQSNADNLGRSSDDEMTQLSGDPSPDQESDNQTSSIDRSLNSLLQRSRSFPNIRLNESEDGFLCLTKTDYTSAMKEIKCQMELALHQQTNEQEMSGNYEEDRVRDYHPTKDEEQRQNTAASENLLSVPSQLAPPPTPITQSSPNLKRTPRSPRRSYVMLTKKKSTAKKNRNRRFAAKLRRSLESYSPMKLKRSESFDSFFPLSIIDTQQTFLTEKKVKHSSQLQGKITRSTSVPNVCEFDWFVKRHSSYGEKIEELREWVRDVWNTWFDEVFPPEDDVSSSEDISEKPLESLDGLQDTPENKKLQSDIRRVFIPDKIPSSVTFLLDDVEEPDRVVRENIKELSRVLKNLPSDKLVERACHLAKRGTLLRKIGEIKLAFDDLNSAISLEPRLTIAYWQRHLIHLLKHQKHDALDDLNALLKIQPKNVHAYRSRADIFASLGDYTMAIVNYSQAIKLDPDNSEAFFQRAKLFEKTGDMLLAMEDFTSVHNLKPSKTDALLKRALFYFNKKSWLMAISDFTELMQQEPLNSTIRTYRARAFWELGQHESSLKDFSAAIHYDPLNTTAYYYRGALLRTTASEQALQDLSVSLMLDSSEKNVLALLHRGILYSETNRYNEALADFEQTLRIDSSLVCAQVNIGIIQMTIIKNYWEAIKRFTAALKQNPTYTRAHVCRADAYALVHDYKAAVRDVTRAIRLLPAERPLYLRRGKYLLQDRQFKLAAFCVQHIATLDKSFVGNSATQQAVVQSFLGNHEEASKTLNLACRRKPVPSMYILLAKTLMKGKRFEEAMQHLRHALELTAIYSDGGSGNGKHSVSDETRIHFLLGQCSTEMGLHEEALSSYNDALKEDSHYSEAYYHRGLCKLKLEIGSGIQDLNRALALNPDLFEAYLSRAAYYSTKQRFSKAILNCNEALRLRPLSVRALLCRGALKFCISAYHHSITDLTRAIELDKQCVFAYYNRAVCLHKTKKYEDALKDYSIVLVLSENDESNTGLKLKSRVFVNRALLYMESDMRDAQNAALDLEKAAILQPNNTQILHAMAICYHKMQDLQGAYSAYTRCLNVKSNFLDAYVGRGDAYADAGQFEKSKSEYERALRHDPSHIPARVHLGYNLHMCGYLQRAWNQFTAVLRQDPKCLSALEGRAITCLHARDYDAAMRDATTAMNCTTSPGARLLTISGVIHQSQKDFHTAMAFYNKARDIDPTYSPAQFNAAVLYLRDHRFSAAYECLQVVVRSNPYDSNALLNRAIVRVFMKDAEGAMNDFNFALQLDPQNSHIYFNRGNLHFMLDNYEKAAGDFSAAFDINPSDYVALKRRADAKGKQGRKEDAVEDYRQSLLLLERHDTFRRLKNTRA